MKIRTAGRAPPKTLRLERYEPSEAQVMAALKQALAILLAQRRLAWWARMNSGKGHLLRRDGSKVWIEFGFEGCSDFLAQLADGRVLALEAKRPSGPIRPAQAEFLQKVAGNGGLAVVARSAEDIWEALK